MFGAAGRKKGGPGRGGTGAFGESSQMPAQRVLAGVNQDLWQEDWLVPATSHVAALSEKKATPKGEATMP
jgi:hypothetical protein